MNVNMTAAIGFSLCNYLIERTPPPPLLLLLLLLLIFLMIQVCTYSTDDLTAATTSLG